MTKKNTSLSDAVQSNANSIESLQRMIDNLNKRAGKVEETYRKYKAHMRLLTRRINMIDGDLIAMQDSIGPDFTTTSQDRTPFQCTLPDLKDEDEDTKKEDKKTTAKSNLDYSNLNTKNKKEEKEEEKYKVYQSFLGVDFKSGMKKPKQNDFAIKEDA